MDLESAACSDFGDDRCATYSQQKTYWISATVINFFGILAMIKFLFDYGTNKRMRKPVVNVFMIMLLGDILWQWVYFPYHANNVAKVLRSNGTTVIVGNTIGCQVSWYFSAFSVTLELVGLCLIAYYPYRMVQFTKNLVGAKRIIGKKIIIGSVILSFILSNIWFFAGFALGQVGSFRGLYCAASEWSNGSGVILFSYIGVAFFIMAGFYYKAYITLHRTATSSLNNSDQVDAYAMKAAKTVLKFGVQMLTAFVLCYGSFTITAFLNVINVYPPITWEMVSGLTIKCKPLIDVLILYSMPAVKSARRAPGLGSTNYSADNPTVTASGHNEVSTRTINDL